jgi:hypothetical protein
MPLSIAFLFLAWVSSAERYWVTLAKRRRMNWQSLASFNNYVIKNQV